MKPPPNPHYRHRIPAEISGHAVWLYHVLSLSLRNVEPLLAERPPPRRQGGAGAGNPARALPIALAAADHDQETIGTSTRCSSGSSV
jgi:hypothetical protein